MREVLGVLSRLRALLWVGLALCSVAFVGVSVYRAATFPFSHDESLSYAIFGWDHSWAATANNHLLNTYSMRLCSRLFGNSELSLRLPNVVAQAFYLGAILFLLSRVRRALVVPGFALLTLNLFQFDYFAVARGYGLALGCIASSLAFFVRAFEAKERHARSLGWFGASLMAGAGGVLANFSVFYYYVALCAVSAWLMMTDETHARPRRGSWLGVAGILGAAGLFAIAVVLRGLRMQQEHMFYEGGSQGFFGDTIVSLIRGSLYLPTYTDGTVRTVAFAVVCLIGLFAALGLWHAWHMRRFVTVPVLLGTMLAVAVLLPVTQHALTGFLLPVDRQALCYVPLAWLVVIFAADAGMTACAAWWLAIAAPLWIAAIAAAAFFGVGFSPARCHSCWYDVHIKDVLATLDADRRTAFPAEQISLANTWELEPPLNFYRLTRGLTWLDPITRDPISVANHQYIYALTRDLAQLQTVPRTVLASFPDSGTVLWRVGRPAGK